MRLAIALVGTWLAVLVLAQLPTPRAVTADSVPARYGAFVLHCTGGFDLGDLPWIADLDRAGRLPYWAQHAEGGGIVSTFGPAPAVVGALAMTGAGDAISDTALRARERYAAAMLIAIAATLLVLAAAARRGLRTSVAIGGLAALSFAGMATLGQGLWQQTVSLPLLVGALATLAWRVRRPGVVVATPALLVAALLVRPALAPLVLGLAVVWVLARPPRRTWVIAGVAAVLVAIPFVAWNLTHLGTPLPLGQATANAALTDETFVLSATQLGYGVGGLVVSPGRGLLWFAPIVLVGVVAAFRTKQDRVIAAALCVQLVTMGLFYRWWGGVGYGPRLLAEVTWVGIWLALASSLDLRGRVRGVALVAIGVTAIVGQLGLWRWRAEQWETRRLPDIDQNALWDFTDSPIPATFRAGHEQLSALDAPSAPASVRCPP